VVLVALLLGGSGSPLGAVVGAALMIALPEFLRFLQQYYQIVYGLGIVALMVFMPEGLIGLGRRLAAGGDWRGRG
jgi:branched-chain amino acid transport system permease protein